LPQWDLSSEQGLLFIAIPSLKYLVYVVHAPEINKKKRLFVSYIIVILDHTT
jgi:hypothetical protein